MSPVRAADPFQFADPEERSVVMAERWAQGFGRVRLSMAMMLAVIVFAAGTELTVQDRVRLVAESREFVLTATIDTSSSTVGIADSDLYFMTADELTTAMDTLKALGVTQVRVFLPWRAIETADGVYDWDQADLLLEMAASYDIAVVAAVTSTPIWASDYGGLVANGEPNSSSDYADFVGALADRYGTAANDGEAKIAAYEIWNEPNGFTGWYPEPDAEQYTELLKAAHTAIKAIDPDATVIGGVLGAGVSIGTLTVNPVTFLAEMYDAGAAGYFDALSFHPYNYTSTFSEGSTFINSAIKQLVELRELMDANGDSNRLIWVTEYGQPSTQVSEENQAAYIADFLATWSEQIGVGPAFIYSLVDTATGSATAEDNLGLYTDDWTAKAVVEVVKTWIAGHPVAVDPEETSGGTVADLLAAWAKAAQSFVASITAMIATSLNGVTEFVRAIVNTITSVVVSITEAGTTANRNALTPKATVESVAASALRSSTTVDKVVDAAGGSVEVSQQTVGADQANVIPTAETRVATDVDEVASQLANDEVADIPTGAEPTEPSDADEVGNQELPASAIEVREEQPESSSAAVEHEPQVDTSPRDEADRQETRTPEALSEQSPSAKPQQGAAPSRRGASRTPHPLSDYESNPRVPNRQIGGADVGRPTGGVTRGTAGTGDDGLRPALAR